MRSAFDELKARLDLQQVTRDYGMDFNRHGKSLCPFHDEKTPSFSIKGQRFHCFGCHAGGSVIDLVARLRDISPLDAARELDAAYGLGLFSDRPQTLQEREAAREAALQRKQEKERVAAFEDWERWACNVVHQYLSLLERWRQEYTPHSLSDIWHPRFIQAVQEYDRWNWTFYAVFIEGNFEDKLDFYKECSREVAALDQYIAAIRAA